MDLPLKVQVYYKYCQYRNVLDLLLEVYNAEAKTGTTLSNLIALCHEKLGVPEKARQFKR